jgi:hypothetical protein
MSDISLNWGLIDIAIIVIILTSPGLAIGGFVGALAWRGHRIAGAALGAIGGVVLWSVGWFYLREFV